MKRYALVQSNNLSGVAAYLPDNYRVIWEGHWEAYDGADFTFPTAVIKGEDSAGWSLGGYVIPRLKTGNFAVQEIDLSHPVMKVIPA